MTIRDLLAFAKRQARLDTSNYYGAPDALKQDRKSIQDAKKDAKKAADWYWSQLDTELMVGSYFGTRLIIKSDSIDYIAGQYAPTEIYHAIEDYFIKFRQDLAS